MNQSSFAHLHSHTEFSLLDGSNRIRDYLDRVKELGMESAAITDHGVMYGVVDFYKYAKEIGIHPVIGCEVYVAPKGVADRSSAERYHHLVLLAENNTGYKNLCQLVSEGFKTGFYYRPRIDFELLSSYHEGLIALSGCLAGEIPRLLTQGNYKSACDTASRYLNLFGADHYYLELQDHGIPEQNQVNRMLIRMGGELGMGHTRKYLMEQYPEVLSQLQYDKKNGMLGQSSLLSLFSSEQSPVKEEEYSTSQLLAYEKEVLGTYLSGHPLDEHYEQWIANVTAKSVDFLCCEEGISLAEGESAVVGGILRTVTMRTTRKKKKMACLVLEDLIGSMEIVVFPEQFEKYQSFLKEGAMVFCRGKVKKEDGKDAGLQMDSVSFFSKEDKKKSIWLQFTDFADYQAKEANLVSIMGKYPGNGRLFFYLRDSKQIKQGCDSISLDETCLAELTGICGKDNIRIK